MWVLWHLVVKGARSQVPVVERSAVDPFVLQRAVQAGNLASS